MKPAVIGIAGPDLAPAEAALLSEAQPAGVILFKRNIEHPHQLAELMAMLRERLPAGAVLMVDQEGGRVARLRPPHWRAHPPARELHSARLAWLTGALIGQECAQAGFDVVCAPVLDVAAPGAHDVIGDRAFPGNPHQVGRLGAAFAAGLLAAGIQPVGKHAPGHGRAHADSHLELPVLDDVAAEDLIPFAANRGLPWLMTAHIRYMQQDMQHPATHSAAVIAGVIRNPAGVGFEGVLVSDDLAMQALTGSPGARAKAALTAGCDVALHCSGVIEDSRAVLAALPVMKDATAMRMAAARRMATAARKELDIPALAAEREALLV